MATIAKENPPVNTFRQGDFSLVLLPDKLGNQSLVARRDLLHRPLHRQDVAGLRGLRQSVATVHQLAVRLTLGCPSLAGALRSLFGLSHLRYPLSISPVSQALTSL